MNIPRIPIKDEAPDEKDWCYDCHRTVDECVCEELSDFHRHLDGRAAGDEAVSVHPHTSAAHNFPSIETQQAYWLKKEQTWTT